MKVLTLFTAVLATSSAVARRTPNNAHSKHTTHARDTSTSLAPRADDVAIIHDRRVSAIIASATQPKNVASWLNTLDANGKWPDNEVDYTSGCPARRANWPAQTHWARILTMASAWRGGLEGADSKYVKDPALRAKIESAMGFWFKNDYTVPACMESGGKAACPCDTPGFWNTNWFSNIILLPRFVSQVCLVLDGTLSDYDRGYCDLIVARSYGTFDRFVDGVGTLTGANTLDVAKNGIDLAVRSPANITLLQDAYRRVHLELVIVDTVKADGIRRDGSFSQHSGMIYNGNYGKDYVNAILGLELAAGGTSYAANSASKSAFDVLLDGDQWMIYRNVLVGNGVLHWDYSVLGRFISFPVVDNQATGNIKFNVSEVRELGQLWSSQKLLEVANRLDSPSHSANAGDLRGNRMFFANDYMVHRGPGYVTTLKLTSSRTVNTECTNTQNPLGFHLADGVVHTYMQGNEYEDIAVAWDWNLIPGTTVDYGATPLTCAQTGWTGVESFAGGASNGAVGIAAMRFTNPATKSLKWQKAWFFLDDDIQHVMVSGIVSTTSAPVYSVLDQRLRSGSVFFDGERDASSVDASNTSSIWHGGVGYVFDQKKSNTKLELRVGDRTGSWQTIGTSSEPPATVPMFAAWLTHQDRFTPLEYAVYPATRDVKAFVDKAQRSQVHTLQNDVHISAVYDDNTQVAFAVFWAASGGCVSFVNKRQTSMVITSAKPITLIYRLDAGTLAVSDPSQTLGTVEVSLRLISGPKPASWAEGETAKRFTFTLPQGGLAGETVTLSA